MGIKQEWWKMKQNSKWQFKGEHADSPFHFGAAYFKQTHVASKMHGQSKDRNMEYDRNGTWIQVVTTKMALQHGWPLDTLQKCCFVEMVYNVPNRKGNHTWWFIPLSKWVITPVISGLTPPIPFITRVVTHLLSRMNHQVHPLPEIDGMNTFKPSPIGGSSWLYSMYSSHSPTI